MPRLKRLGPLALLLLLLLALPAYAARSVSEAALEGEVYDLDAVTVKGERLLPKPEQWRYAQMDDFEVLSNAPDRVANRVLKAFQKLRFDLSVARPMEAQPLTSFTLILCYRADAFAGFLPSDVTTAHRNGLVSQLLREREKASIIIDLNTLRYEVRTLGGAVVELEADHSLQLLREYARFLLTQGAFPPPAWLVEGNIQLILDIESYGRVINYGKLDINRGAPETPDDGDDPQDFSRAGEAEEEEEDELDFDANTMENYLRKFRHGGALAVWTADPPFSVALARRELLPLDTLFAATAHDAEARNPLTDLAWSKLAHAFVHFCRFGAMGDYEPAFERFVARLADEPPSEALFEECFQLSYAEMSKKLSSHIRYTKHRYRRYMLDKGERPDLVEVAFRDATQGEIARIKGDAQSLAGLHAAAYRTYRTGYERGERDPMLLGSLAKAELRAGKSLDAAELIEMATESGSASPSDWTTLARLTLDEAKSAPAANGGISAEQLASVLKPLLQARSLQPPISEPYALMAEAWELAAIEPSPAHVDLIGEGVLRFPSDSILAYRVAQLYARIGENARAADVARLGIQFANTDATRSSFARLLETLGTP